MNCSGAYTPRGVSAAAQIHELLDQLERTRPLDCEDVPPRNPPQQQFSFAPTVSVPKKPPPSAPSPVVQVDAEEQIDEPSDVPAPNDMEDWEDWRGLLSAPGMVLVDVRTPKELLTSMLPDSVHIEMPFPWEGLDEKADQITADAIRDGKIPADKNTPIMVYCGTGVRSGRTGQALTALGYRNVESGPLDEVSDAMVALGKLDTATGSKFDSNAENRTAYEKGELDHEPPFFTWFDPHYREVQPTHLKEVKLPLDQQTHEIIYEPVTNCCYVSQFTSSTLVRIPFDDDGFLRDDQDAWNIGARCPETGMALEGLHNISLSYAHKGCIWISMQYGNQLILVDVTAKNNLRIRKILEVPTHYIDDTGQKVYVGGPHCVRECPFTGDVWTGLKGNLEGTPCSRQKEEHNRSSCCDPTLLDECMTKLEDMGRDTPIPTGWAVWHCDPSKYDKNAADGAKGGVLYPCLPSPVMLDFDCSGNCYIAQDQVPTITYINRAEGTARQLMVPYPPQSIPSERKAGPIRRNPYDGSIWMAQLFSSNVLVRIDPANNNQMTIYDFGSPSWATKIATIHMAFSQRTSEDDHNMIYAIGSDLLDGDALDAVAVLQMCPNWRQCMARRVIPLPTQDVSCHRIDFVDTGIAGRPDLSRSIVISELAASKVLQIKVQHLRDFVRLDEEKSHFSMACKSCLDPNKNSFEFRKYTEAQIAQSRSDMRGRASKKKWVQEGEYRTLTKLATAAAPVAVPSLQQNLRQLTKEARGHDKCNKCKTNPAMAMDMTKDEMCAKFVQMSAASREDWSGELRDLFSPNDTNSAVIQFFIDDIQGDLCISQAAGENKWGKKFDLESVIDVQITLEPENAGVGHADFKSKIETSPAPQEAKDQAANGALTFTLVLGEVDGTKVIKFNGMYDGKGGPFLFATEGGMEPPTDCGNFWVYV